MVIRIACGYSFSSICYLCIVCFMHTHDNCSCPISIVCFIVCFTDCVCMYIYSVLYRLCVYVYSVLY
jgi:hypothetical protein